MVVLIVTTGSTAKLASVIADRQCHGVPTCKPDCFVGGNLILTSRSEWHARTESSTPSDTPMAFNLTVPRPSGGSLDLVVGLGEILFVLGANGTGKSGLMYHFYRTHQGNSRRISAHRQSWFETDTINMSPADRRSVESGMRGSDSNPDSRWMDRYSGARPNIAIFDLIDAENVRARSIANAVDQSDVDLARTLSRKDAPIKVINELLRLSNIPIEIMVREGERIVASKSGGAPYSVAQLSDGERNALLISANVLTVKEGTLILIDEPERHLHRSIISPLLTLLFTKRPDCAFVISTHDVMLPLDNPGTRTLLVRGCAHTGPSIAAWDADLVPSESEIDDDLKRDILGARRKLLFIEGSDKSLDKPLYSLVFPSVSVIAKSTCRDVEHAVFGIRDAATLHWVRAFGIVDNDGRTETDINELRSRGVYALSVFSVESIYYHPDIQRRVVERHAAITGEDVSTRLANAKAAAIAAIAPHVRRLSERVVEKTLREHASRHLPRRAEIAAGTPFNISIDVAAAVAAERARLEAALGASDVAAIIARYPVRETPALAEIASNLGFQSRRQYERAVRKLMIDDGEALTLVRSLFGTLAADIDAA
jgi:ABC-type lipoprotein export system ATPase subunit